MLLERKRISTRSHHSHSMAHFHYAYRSKRRLLTCAHLKLLGPCFKTGQMGDRPDTEWGTEQWTADSRNTKAECMHHTRASQLPTTHHEFTNPFIRPSPTAFRPTRFLASQSSCRPSNRVLGRFGALCTQVHSSPTRPRPPGTLQNPKRAEHTG